MRLTYFPFYSVKVSNTAHHAISSKTVKIAQKQHESCTLIYQEWVSQFTLNLSQLSFTASFDASCVCWTVTGNFNENLYKHPEIRKSLIISQEKHWLLQWRENTVFGEWISWKGYPYKFNFCSLKHD